MCKTCGCKDAETLEGEDCGCKHENEAESFGADDVDWMKRFVNNKLTQDDIRQASAWSWVAGKNNKHIEKDWLASGDLVGEEDTGTVNGMTFFEYLVMRHRNFTRDWEKGIKPTRNGIEYGSSLFSAEDKTKFELLGSKYIEGVGIVTEGSPYLKNYYGEMDEYNIYDDDAAEIIMSIPMNDARFPLKGGEIELIRAMVYGYEHPRINDSWGELNEDGMFWTTKVMETLANYDPSEAESFEATSDELDCPSCKATPTERLGEPLCSTCNSCFECCETLCEDESFEAEMMGSVGDIENHSVDKYKTQHFLTDKELSDFLIKHGTNHDSIRKNKKAKGNIIISTPEGGWISEAKFSLSNPDNENDKDMLMIIPDDYLGIHQDAESFEAHDHSHIYPSEELTPSHSHSSETFKSSNNNNNIMAAESKFDKLSDKIAKQYRKKGMSAKKAKEIGNKTAYTIGRKKYGKAGMAKKARAGMRAESFEADENHTNKDYKNMQKDLNKFVNTFCKCKHSKGAPSALNIYTSCGYCGKEIDEVSFYGLTKDAESFEAQES